MIDSWTPAWLVLMLIGIGSGASVARNHRVLGAVGGAVVAHLVFLMVSRTLRPELSAGASP